MTASQKIKQLILSKLDVKCDTPEQVESSWRNVDEDDELYDAMHDVENEVREGEYETSIPCDYSRHYESKSVAAMMLDGTHVGWTYWYGGGKHGEPGSMPWIENAYDVTFEEKTVVVKVFTKVE